MYMSLYRNNARKKNKTCNPLPFHWQNAMGQNLKILVKIMEKPDTSQ